MQQVGAARAIVDLKRGCRDNNDPSGTLLAHEGALGVLTNSLGMLPSPEIMRHAGSL